MFDGKYNLCLYVSMYISRIPIESDKMGYLRCRSPEVLKVMQGTTNPLNPSVSNYLRTIDTLTSLK